MSLSLSLTPRCPTCNKTDKLLRCLGCGVMFYCGKEHQASDRPAHKKACSSVKKVQKHLEIEEQKLRNHPGDFMTPDNIFENGVGHFWGIHETRPYMRARHVLVDALLTIKTKAAVQAALDHVLDILRLCRGDNMGVRSIAPGLYLRLGKDQECYDFVKWWRTTGQESDYDWGNTDNPYLDVKDADAFEESGFVGSKYTDPSFGAAITVLKIRLLLDLKALQNASLIGKKVPQELLDQIRGQLVSTIVGNNKDIMDSEDQGPLVKKLEDQVKQMHVAVGKSNKYFWPALLNPGPHLTATLTMYSHGTIPHMQLCLQQSYDSWAETPGAIDIIRKLEKGEDL
ncbi:hypothetical protein ONS95_003051 [Cadophora gregata]|uniref:uncharacterized protein n=1 Tax=Cadophora gregata TaxID=51156 RepID=UPI0026DBB54B|nr:uncharacterized protein ONS95_003051 [Cadophora gregata]KAK0108231.1 hypothetical protein ONS95_003051 [Cadophora gregata]KAK0109177.1 hypothetical protein ONS96_003000 [Cadophora gregata f. sp. sojae]